jgi:hypothetical protein
MNHESALSKATELAGRVLAPGARQNDKEGRFSAEAMDALGRSGFLGLMLPTDSGGAGLGPRSFAAVTAALAQADASVAMVYLMHVCATSMIAAARPGAAVAKSLQEIAAGRHLITFAISEAGSRSHFWAPISRARRNASGVYITAKKSWVTSAGHAQSYVVSSLAYGPDRFNALSRSARDARLVGRWPLGRSGAAGQRLGSDDPRRLRGTRGAASHGGWRGFQGYAGSRAAAVQSGDDGCGAWPLSRRCRGNGVSSQEPTGDVLREFIGRAVLGLPLF